MDKRAKLEKEFLELRAEFHVSGIKSQTEFSEKISSYVKTKTLEERNMIAEIMTEYVEKDIEELDNIYQEVTLRKSLERVYDAVSWSYIAEHYFGRSRSWLSQRINNLLVNGKKAQFTPTELNTLQKALIDLSKDIQNTANGLSIN